MGGKCFFLGSGANECRRRCPNVMLWYQVLWESKYLNNFVRFGREAKANDYNNY
jgi:hypothetical protein